MARRQFSPDLLRAEMKRLGVSNRELGKRVHPNSPEPGRKALLKHLAGRHIPNEVNVQRYADALGIPRENLEEPIEEEDEMLARLDEIRARWQLEGAA